MGTKYKNNKNALIKIILRYITIIVVYSYMFNIFCYYS